MFGEIVLCASACGARRCALCEYMCALCEMVRVVRVVVCCYICCNVVVGIVLDSFGQNRSRKRFSENRDVILFQSKFARNIT